MADRDVRERDILVAPNEYAYVQDLTKGEVVLYVGPTKISLSNTERMIVLRDGRFVPVRGDDAGVGVHAFVAATSSQYIILDNPTEDTDVRPVKGANHAVPLLVGRQVVIPGPAEFPLWPGQHARVIDGHRLTESEYLIVRVYDNADHDLEIGVEQIVRGSDVSFYVPASGMEVVPCADGRYVRRALRMDRNRGLHVRVTEAFEASDDEQVPPGNYRPGQDLFLRDREGYFFPTDSLEVIGRVAPIALAEKEAIYVRALDSGRISTVQGPCNYLVDPTREEIATRVMSASLCQLYRIEGTAGRAVSIYIPPSTAVLVTAKNRRQVEIGPQTRVLDFDEELEVLTLSTGRPKSDTETLETCFLQVHGNRVSDVVAVRTADHVQLELHVSYRVSFTGDAERWFAVKDYVGLLCDHLGSIIRATARVTPIEEFHARSTSIVRNAVLGERSDSGERVGRHFAENGMWVYDLELLDVCILDEDVESLLCEAQRMAIVSTISRKQEELRLGDEQLKERVAQEIYTARIATQQRAAAFETANREASIARTKTQIALDEIEVVGRAESRARALAVEAAARMEAAQGEVEVERTALAARAESFERQMGALQPELIGTLKLLGNKQLAAELSRNLSPLAILGGESVADVVTRLLDHLPLGASASEVNGQDVRKLFSLAAVGDEDGSAAD